MDQQLKQRLIGVTIVVALVVIFVPMLFERSDDKGKFNSTGVPPLPDDVMEQAIELPKTADEIGPKKEEEQQKPVDEGFKLVPMNEEPPPKPKPVEGQAEKPATNQAVEADKPAALEKEPENRPVPEKTGKKIKHVIKPTEPVKLAPDHLQDEEKLEPNSRHSTQPKTASTTKKPKTGSPKSARNLNEQPEGLDGREVPAPVPLKTKALSPSTNKLKTSTASTTKPVDTADNKSEAAKKADALKELVKRHRLARENKPKSSTVVPQIDRDLDEEPVLAPARPETKQVKTKPSSGSNPKQTGTSNKTVDTAKKPGTTKPPESKPSTVKPEKPKSVATPTHSPTKPKPSKPAPTPVDPAKSGEPDKPKPQTMAPGRQNLASMTALRS